MRYTKLELELLKATFAERDDVLKLLRKVFLPSIKRSDEIGVLTDMLLSMDDNADMVKIAEAVQWQLKLVKHIEGQLVQLKTLANRKEETAEEVAARISKDRTE